MSENVSARSTKSDQVNFNQAHRDLILVKLLFVPSKIISVKNFAQKKSTEKTPNNVPF